MAINTQANPKEADTLHGSGTQKQQFWEETPSHDEGASEGHDIQRAYRIENSQRAVFNRLPKTY